MRNQTGSALVMVMGILMIVSLIGAGLLFQSRYDTIFTRAVASRQHSFGLADGGASAAIENLSTWAGEVDNEQWTGKMIFKKLANDPIKTVTGNYDASGFFKAYDKAKGRGWDAGAFFNEFWITQGRGDSGGATTIIDAAMIKVNRAGYGDY